MQEQAKPQHIPVKVYRTEDRISVAAPMPGLESDNITVEVTPQNHLVLRGAVRGLLKGDKQLLVDEWSVGDYHRDLELPAPVNGSEANVTYGNGVVVVALPVADKTTPAHLQMRTIYDSKGERVGNAGHPPQPMTTAQHEANLVDEWLLHGGAPGAEAHGGQGQSRPGTGAHG